MRISIMVVERKDRILGSDWGRTRH